MNINIDEFTTMLYDKLSSDQLEYDYYRNIVTFKMSGGNGEETSYVKYHGVKASIGKYEYIIAVDASLNNTHVQMKFDIYHDGHMISNAKFKNEKICEWLMSELDRLLKYHYVSAAEVLRLHSKKQLEIK